MIAATGHGISVWDPPSRRHSARPAECTFSLSTSADFVRTAWGVDDFSGRFRSSARTHLAHSAFHEWGVHDSDIDIVMDLTAVAIVAIPTCTSALLGREPLLRAIASLLDLSLSALPPLLFPREAATSGDLYRRMISVDEAVVYSWRSSIADFLYFCIFWCVAVAPFVRALDKEMAESATQHTPGAAALSEAGAIRPACPLSSQRSARFHQYF